jgi:hypothetical protein
MLECVFNPDKEQLTDASGRPERGYGLLDKMDRSIRYEAKEFRTTHM